VAIGKISTDTTHRISKKPEITKWFQYAPNKTKMADGPHFEKKPLNRDISATD